MIHFGLKDVTPALCKQLRQLGLVNCWYNKSCTSTLKNVAKVYVVLLCKATNNERLDEHNAEFGQALIGGSLDDAAGDVDDAAGDVDSIDGDAASHEAEQSDKD